VHTSEPSLALALRLGVSTELEMQGTNTRSQWRAVEDDDAVANAPSSGFGITPPGAAGGAPRAEPLMTFSTSPAQRSSPS
jgi:hypothetical protein